MFPSTRLNAEFDHGQPAGQYKQSPLISLAGMQRQLRNYSVDRTQFERSLSGAHSAAHASLLLNTCTTENIRPPTGIEMSFDGSQDLRVAEHIPHESWERMEASR